MKAETRSGWWWVPSLYYAEGIPYNIAMVVSVVMYKTMGISNTAIAFWTSVLYLPWTFKPLWSPFVDVISTKRSWVLWMQFLLAVTFFGVAAAISLPWYFPATLGVLWLVAFASATHDIAADGFYMLGLDEHGQAWFVGIRATFYRAATITAIGLIVMLAGLIEENTGLEPVETEVKAVPAGEFTPFGNPDTIHITPQEGTPRILIFPRHITVPLHGSKVAGQDSARIFIALSAPPPDRETIVVHFGRKSGSNDIYQVEEGRFEFTAANWNKPQQVVLKTDKKLKSAAEATFGATAGDTPFSWMISFIILGILMLVFAIYHKFMLPYPVDIAGSDRKNILSSWVDVFKTFLEKKGVLAGIFFLLFYRLAESQLVKLASPFLLDAQETGGLALTTTEVGLVYGTVGIGALLIGGLAGGFLAARDGLKKWIWWMAIAINIPDLVYVYFAYALPDNLLVVTAGVAIEQLGYGFGFTGYMLYMIFISAGKYKTSHFAITTMFMAFGMMLPGMLSGYLQEILGYQHFFIWVMIATVPSFIVLKFLYIDPEFGKKRAENKI
jgi:PAT family beta-lactamase induction signal transducer AmpG